MIGSGLGYAGGISKTSFNISPSRNDRILHTIAQKLPHTTGCDLYKWPQRWVITL